MSRATPIFPIIHATFTGLDERTSFSDTKQLLRDYQFAEFAVLYSEKRAGREPRYPALDAVRKFAALGRRRVALHVCGSVDRPYACEMIAKAFGRVQINGAIQESELRRIRRALAAGQHLVIQCQTPDDPLVGLGLSGYQILMDVSGGRGVAPERFQRPETSRIVGFAGGLGPDTIEARLPEIKRVARPGDWVDMESGIRTDDWLDLDKVRAVCEILWPRRAS